MESCLPPPVPPEEFNLIRTTTAASVAFENNAEYSCAPGMFLVSDGENDALDVTCKEDQASADGFKYVYGSETKSVATYAAADWERWRCDRGEKEV